MGNFTCLSILDESLYQMCGIAFVYGDEEYVQCICNEIEIKLSARGPNHFASINTSPQCIFSAAVLHLRSPQLVSQPCVDTKSNILCWNGEIFGDFNSLSPPFNMLEDNDTLYLVQVLENIAIETDKLVDNGEMTRQVQQKQIANVFMTLQGPFAFLWYHYTTGVLYFGHDRYGRRSLVWNAEGQDEIVALSKVVTLTENIIENGEDNKGVTLTGIKSCAISSVGIKGNQKLFSNTLEEVPCFGIFALEIRPNNLDVLKTSDIHITCYKYPPLPTLQQSPVDTYHCPKLPLSPLQLEEHRSEYVTGLLLSLSNAVGKRIRSIPSTSFNDGFTSSQSRAKVAVFFSGGVDSVVIAALTHFHVPLDEPIDLINVCFDEKSNYQSPDRLAATIALKELQTLYPLRKWVFVQLNISFFEVEKAQYEVLDLMRPCSTHMDLNIGTAFWFLSRGIGGINDNANFVYPLLSIESLSLKSNHESIPKVEANQVCKCKRKIKPGCHNKACKICCLKLQGRFDTNSDQNYLPTTKYGIDKSNTTEKMAACPVHSKNDQKHQNRIVENPILPIVTLKPYISTAQVVLVGIGADEQLGGYSRHRTAFEKGGESALQEELFMDMSRLWYRNLGRDDRCISAHGKESRFPFLDENVIIYLRTLSASEIKCDFTQPRGIGEKYLLRLVAQRLGIQYAAKLPKRAIQFGTRLAKQTNTKMFSSNRQATGIATI